MELKCYAVLTANITTAPGTQLGLLIMLDGGLRNNEACGLVYGSVRKEGSIYYLVVYETQDEKGKKAGGKSRNASRYVPISQEVYSMIAMRRSALIRRIKENYEQYVTTHPKAAIAETIESYVDGLPLVAMITDPETALTPRDLTSAGKVLLRTVGYSSTSYFSIAQALRTPGGDEEEGTTDLENKEPTTYLLRRNYATNLVRVGFQPAEIQYLMGHAVTDGLYFRNYFNNMDQLELLAKRLARRPLHAYMKPSTTFALTDTGEVDVPSGAHDIEVMLAPGEEIILEARANEPEDAIELGLIEDDDKPILPNVESWSRTAKPSTDRPVDILDAVYDVYRAAAQAIANENKSPAIRKDDLASSDSH